MSRQAWPPRLQCHRGFQKWTGCAARKIPLDRVGRFFLKKFRLDPASNCIMVSFQPVWFNPASKHFSYPSVARRFHYLQLVAHHRSRLAPRSKHLESFTSSMGFSAATIASISDSKLLVGCAVSHSSPASTSIVSSKSPTADGSCG